MCQAPLRGVDVNTRFLLGKCRKCGGIFHFRGLFIDDQGNGIFAGVYREEMPRGGSIEDRDSCGRIERCWFSGVVVLFAIVALAADVAMGVFWYRIRIVGDMALGGTAGQTLAAILILVGLPVTLTYCTLAGLLNRTTIDVGEDWLDVRQGLIPWPGNRRVAVEDVQELVCDETQRFSRGSNRPTITYNLIARLAQGGMLHLLSELPTSGETLVYQMLLEKWLGFNGELMADN
jgi:hypothetical protein